MLNGQAPMAPVKGVGLTEVDGPPMDTVVVAFTEVVGDTVVTLVVVVLAGETTEMV